ncbi:MAG TPA: hypothetical protein VGK38_11640, partial [Prolixibacteraceae bacterium]
MFVFNLVEKEISEVLVADAKVQTGQQAVVKPAQQKQTGAKTKSAVTNSAKTIARVKPANNQLKKEVFQKNSYTEEPVVKDATWNIYTG